MGQKHRNARVFLHRHQSDTTGNPATEGFANVRSCLGNALAVRRCHAGAVS